MCNVSNEVWHEVLPLIVSCLVRYFYVVACLWYIQTMGGDFLAKGRQDCSKGVYVLAGPYSQYRA